MRGGRVDFGPVIAFMARAPARWRGDCDSEGSCAHCWRDRSARLSGCGAVRWVGLGRTRPRWVDAYLSAQFVEVSPWMADPVAIMFMFGEGVHVGDLSSRRAARGWRLRASSRPSPPPRMKDLLTPLTGDGEGVHAAVGDFANAEGGVVGRRMSRTVLDEVEMEGVEVLRNRSRSAPEFGLAT